MKKHWQSLDEFNGIPDREEKNPEKEHKNAVLDLFEDDITGSHPSRRNFLKLLGFSVTSAAIISSCEKPVQKAIPYVIAPEEVDPGLSRYYASSFFDGKDFCNILVKIRDGRPIKIEGNELAKFNKGGTTARIQASILNLYDDARLKYPSKAGEKTSWDEIDNEIRQRLKEINEAGKEIVLLSSSLVSPSTKRLIAEFGEQYNKFNHVVYDAVSYSGILEAAEKSYGIGVIPDYRFDRADVVVSFGADFLGSWLAPVHFIPSYVSRRKLDQGEKDMLYHVQIESAYSLTGANADKRIQIRPSEELMVLASLYNELAAQKSAPLISIPGEKYEISEISVRLSSAGSRGLVISGSNDVNCQLLVNAINQLLGNSGITVDFNSNLNVASGLDKEMVDLLNRMESGEVGALMMYNVNPAYNYPESDKFLSALEKTELSINFGNAEDETVGLCDYICPVHHYMESWDDAEVIPGNLSLCQPAIHPIYETRSFQDSLLKWMGNDIEYLEYIKEYWRENHYTGTGDFNNWWIEKLQKGFHEYNIMGSWARSFNNQWLSEISSKINNEDIPGLEIVIQESVQLGDGRNSNNPWLQELPDPVTKLSWENALLISPADAEEWKVTTGEIVTINDDIQVPVLVQPGQAKGSCTLALGYGRTSTGKVANNVGINAYPLVQILEGKRIYTNTGISLKTSGQIKKLALSQTHNSMEGRPIVRNTNLDEYLENPASGNEIHETFEERHTSLYPEPEISGFHWGMVVDLNACVGCNTCVIACQAENNIPVVGKDEVRRNRIMHWMRIHRYYSEEPQAPEVLFQPILCQHCDHAPCENVCPVSATNHSSEGLNQMSYNRCIGIKYCINNCPYRVRRFNWFQYNNNDEFDYHVNSDLGKMVLNPDVTVRSRGVVEKCTFCVQRIQEKKLLAKLENRVLEDGEIQPACVQACPADALIFGDMKNSKSRVVALLKDPRNYHLLEDLHTLPSVGYLTKVKNRKG